MRKGWTFKNKEIDSSRNQILQSYKHRTATVLIILKKRKETNNRDECFLEKRLKAFLSKKKDNFLYFITCYGILLLNEINANKNNKRLKEARRVCT